MHDTVRAVLTRGRASFARLFAQIRDGRDCSLKPLAAVRVPVELALRLPADGNLTYTNDDRPYPSCLPLWGRWLTQSAGEGYSTYTITVMPMRTVSSGVKSTYATYCALC